MVSTTDIITLNNFSELEQLRDDWEKLYRECGSQSHYLMFDFISLWYTCFATPKQVRIFRVTADGRSIGYMPLVLKKEKGIRILSGLTNFHCMHSGPLVCQGEEARFSATLLDGLKKSRPEWDVLKLEYSNDFDRFPTLFSAELLDSKKVRWRRLSEPTYTVNLNSDFKAYLASISNNSRKNYAKMRKRYEQEGSWSVQIFKGNEAVSYWDIFVKLENSGWKGEKGSSIYKLADEYKCFYNGLISLLAKSNKLNISVLSYGEQIIASSFMYREGNILHKFKSGYDNDNSDKSPSNMLTIETVKLLYEQNDGINLINEFIGSYGYKHKFLQQNYNSNTLLLYRNTLRGIALNYYHGSKA